MKRSFSPLTLHSLFKEKDRLRKAKAAAKKNNSTAAVSAASEKEPDFKDEGTLPDVQVVSHLEKDEEAPSASKQNLTNFELDEAFSAITSTIATKINKAKLNKKLVSLSSQASYKEEPGMDSSEFWKRSRIYFLQSDAFPIQYLAYILGFELKHRQIQSVDGNDVLQDDCHDIDQKIYHVLMTRLSHIKNDSAMHVPPLGAIRHRMIIDMPSKEKVAACLLSAQASNPLAPPTQSIREKSVVVKLDEEKKMIYCGDNSEQLRDEITEYRDIPWTVHQDDFLSYEDDIATD